MDSQKDLPNNTSQVSTVPSTERPPPYQPLEDKTILDTIGDVLDLRKGRKVAEYLEECYRRLAQGVPSADLPWKDRAIKAQAIIPELNAFLKTLKHQHGFAAHKLDLPCLNFLDDSACFDTILSHHRHKTFASIDGAIAEANDIKTWATRRMRADDVLLLQSSGDARADAGFGHCQAELLVKVAEDIVNYQMSIRKLLKEKDRAAPTERPFLAQDVSLKANWAILHAATRFTRYYQWIAYYPRLVSQQLYEVDANEKAILGLTVALTAESYWLRLLEYRNLLTVDLLKHSPKNGAVHINAQYLVKSKRSGLANKIISFVEHADKFFSSS